MGQVKSQKKTDIKFKKKIFTSLKKSTVFLCKNSDKK